MDKIDRQYYDNKYIQYFIDKWTKIALSTAPADKFSAEECVDILYQSIKLKSPKIVWVSSPMQFNNQGDNIIIPKMFKRSVGEKADWSARRETFSKLFDLMTSVARPIHRQISREHKLETFMEAPVYIYSGYVPFFAFCDFNKYKSLELEVSKSAGWWLPLKKTCYISERPNILEVANNQLHCDNGPAIRFQDCKFWAIRGVGVDEQIVMSPESQNISQITTEMNTEVKRIRIERFGWERYLNQTKSRVIDKRNNDAECTKEVLVETHDNMTLLLCHCPSTGRIYTMEVPSNTQSCEQAQNYLWSGSRQAKLNLIGRS